MSAAELDSDTLKRVAVGPPSDFVFGRLHLHLCLPDYSSGPHYHASPWPVVSSFLAGGDSILEALPPGFIACHQTALVRRSGFGVPLLARGRAGLYVQRSWVDPSRKGHGAGFTTPPSLGLISSVGPLISFLHEHKPPLVIV